MKVIVEKIDGNIATVELENGEMVNLPSIILSGAEEGDIVEIIVRKDETYERQEMIEELANRLFEE